MDNTHETLRAAIKERYGLRMPYYIVVTGATPLAACCDVAAEVRNSTGKPSRWAVWKQVGGRWAMLFEFEATVDADEESARLDALFEANGLSTEQRRDLMYDEERAV